MTHWWAWAKAQIITIGLRGVLNIKLTNGAGQLTHQYRCEDVDSNSSKQCGEGDYNGRICICDQNKCDACPEGTSSAGYVGANIRCSLCPGGNTTMKKAANAKFARSEELPKRPAKPAAQCVKMQVLVISI